MKNRLKVLRAERDLSQAELADALKVSRQTINAIETGKYDPSLPLALRLGRLFGQPVEAIFSLDESDGAAVRAPASPATRVVGGERESA
jgi:putative transcriptional regulator